MGNLIIALVVTLLVLGGPLTLYILIKLLNSAWGTPKARFVKTDVVEEGRQLLGLLVSWDEESEAEIARVRIDFYELVRGGRSASFSFTFDDKGSKKRSFLIPMKLRADDYLKLTDRGLPDQARSLERSHVQVEMEDVQGNTIRRKIPKKKILEALAADPYVAPKQVEVLPATQADSWSVLTRVFPWRQAVAAAEPDEKSAAKVHGAPAGANTPRAAVDFIVTKVWIEPGCIVCDACENEAPLVFQVLADTCIVREGAPLDDGASIKAAAEGCPVDVIKFTKVAKSA